MPNAPANAKSKQLKAGKHGLNKRNELWESTPDEAVLAGLESCDSSTDAEAFAAAAAASLAVERQKTADKARLEEERMRGEACDAAGFEGNAAMEGQLNKEIC